VADDQEVEARDRWKELLEELRVVHPGVQVLFAFLLTAPFAQGFRELDDFGKRGFLVALLGAATASICIIGTTAYHRMNRETPRMQRLRIGIWLTRIAFVALAVAMTAAILVVTRQIFGAGVGVTAASGAGLLSFGLWFIFPLSQRGRR
jgi:uncharacterized protein DUF6328